MIIKTNENEFNNYLKNHQLVLVDFYAEWCGPCKMLSPVLEEISKTHPEVAILKINVDENPNLCQTYKVMSIPYVLFFKNGELVDSFLGFQSKDQVINFVEKNC